MRSLVLAVALPILLGAAAPAGCAVETVIDTGDLATVTVADDEAVDAVTCTVETLIGTCEDGEVTTGLMPGATLISLLELDEDGASDELTPEQVFLDPEEEASRVNLTAACTDDYRIRALIIWCR